MEFSHNEVSQYCTKSTTEVDKVLYELERETYLKALSPNMISGRLQGKFLEFLSGMLQSKSILEIGTFSGYASICLARGLASDGILHTIEVNPEIAWIAKKYFKKADLTKKINYYSGDAREIIPTMEIEFDLIFIDAAKPDNDFYYETVLPKLKTNGIILVDNVLWAGKVMRNAKDKDTQNIMLFNQKLKNDKRVEVVMLPLRDGLTMVRKK